MNAKQLKCGMGFYVGSQITITSCNDLLNTIIVGVYSHWSGNINAGDGLESYIATKLALKFHILYGFQITECKCTFVL